MRTKKISELPVCPDEEIDNLKTIGVNAQNESYQVPMNKIKGSAGGMSDEVYAAIKNNIETLRSMLYTLIKTWLANLAFTNGRPSDQMLSPIASAFNNWPSNGGGGGGETPTPSTPSLTLRENNSAGAVIANNSEVNVGTAQESNSYEARKTIYIKGENLSEDLVVSLNGTAGLSTGMGLSGTIRASEAEAGTSLVLIYNGNSGTASGSLSISSNEVSININLRAAYMSQGGGGTVDPESYQVSAGTLSHVQITETLPATVSSGGSFTGHLVADTDNGYSLPSSIAVSGTHGTVSYDQSTGVFTIPNIRSNVAISATAVAPVSIELVQGKYIAYQGTSPRTPSNASLYTDICCMTAVLSVDFSDIDETVWETAYIEWVHGGIASKGNISFTKNNGTTAESVQGASSEKDTYSVDNMTSQTLSYWKQRRTLVNGLIATFKYDTSTNKVASGCCVVLKDANGNILKTLISANDLQDATFVTE